MAADHPPTSLYLLRHGTTNHNSSAVEKIRGWLPVPLNDEGRRQAADAAKRLRGVGIRRIVASDLPRTRETARIVSRHLGGIPVSESRSLRPWDTGYFTGKPKSMLMKALPTYLHDPDKRVPSGESYGSFLDRWGSALSGYLKSSVPTLLITSHTNFLSLPSLLDGKAPSSLTDGRPRPGEFVTIDVRSGRPKVSFGLPSAASSSSLTSRGTLKTSRPVRAAEGV